MRNFIMYLVLVLVLVQTVQASEFKFINLFLAYEFGSNFQLMNHECGHLTEAGSSGEVEFEFNLGRSSGITWCKGFTDFDHEIDFYRAGFQANNNLYNSIIVNSDQNFSGLQRQTMAVTVLFAKLEFTAYVLVDDLGLKDESTSDISNLRRLTKKSRSHFRKLAVLNTVLNLKTLVGVFRQALGKGEYIVPDDLWGFQTDGVDSYVTYITRF